MVAASAAGGCRDRRRRDRRAARVSAGTAGRRNRRGETGVVATTDFAARISWGPKSLGKRCGAWSFPRHGHPDRREQASGVGAAGCRDRGAQRGWLARLGTVGSVATMGAGDLEVDTHQDRVREQPSRGIRSGPGNLGTSPGRCAWHHPNRPYDHDQRRVVRVLRLSHAYSTGPGSAHVCRPRPFAEIRPETRRVRDCPQGTREVREPDGPYRPATAGSR